MASKSAAGKILTVYMPIFAFVVCGFEHCVANMYYLSAGLMAAAEYGLAASGLNIGNALLYSLTISGGDEALCAALSPEACVTAESSPAFIWHTFADDCVPVYGSLAFAQQYLKYGVPFDLHVFEKGWHGLSVLNGEVLGERALSDPAVMRAAAWKELALSWLSARGFAVQAGE